MTKPKKIPQFEDSWPVVVSGDWRDREGNVLDYDPTGLDQKVLITGGIGFYFFFRFQFKAAINSWINDLSVIYGVEQETGKRIHKGLFYYQIALSYQYLWRNARVAKDEEEVENSRTQAIKFMKFAQKEDMLSYGEKAKDFPSFKNDWTKTMDQEGKN